MKSYLEEAEEISGNGGERKRDYGSPLLNHLRIAVRWNILFMQQLKAPITPDQVALAMIDLKIARQQQTHKRDNFVDMAGYINCIDSMNRDMVKLGYLDGIQAFTGFTFEGLISLLEQLENTDDSEAVLDETISGILSDLLPGEYYSLDVFKLALDKAIEKARDEREKEMVERIRYVFTHPWKPTTIDLD